MRALAEFYACADRGLARIVGERVVDAIPDIGYLHSGFEKLGESLDFNQYVTVTGTAYDVAYMDGTTDDNNTVY